MIEKKVSKEEEGKEDGKKVESTKRKTRREISAGEEFRQTVTGERYLEASEEIGDAIQRYDVVSEWIKDYEKMKTDLKGIITAEITTSGCEGFYKYIDNIRYTATSAPQTRQSLDKDKLAELLERHGIDPTELGSCMTTSEFFVFNVRSISKPKR